MGKLSHIEDVEARQAAFEQAQMQAAQEAIRQAQQPAAASEQGQPEADSGFSVQEPADHDAQEPRLETTASQEEDFHGLSSVDSMGVGQKFLIVLAIVVVVAAVLYILDSWLHFA